MTTGFSEVISFLAARRQESGMTLGMAAQQMQTSKSEVRAIESGTRDIRLSTLQRYARAVGVTLRVEVETPDGPAKGPRAAVAGGGPGKAGRM